MVTRKITMTTKIRRRAALKGKKINLKTKKGHILIHPNTRNHSAAIRNMKTSTNRKVLIRRMIKLISQKLKENLKIQVLIQSG